jgi:WD40 repeat protein
MSVQIQLFAQLTGHREAVYALVPGPENHLFYSAGGDGMVVEWDLKKPSEGRLIARMPATIYALEFDRSSQCLYAGLRNGAVYKLQIGSPSSPEIVTLHSEVFALQLLDNCIIAGTGKGTLYRLDKDLSLESEINISDKSCRTICASPRSLLATGWSDNHIRIFDFGLNELYDFTAHENSVFALHYSADGSRLFSGGRDAKLNEWDAINGYELIQSLPAHWFTINHITVSDNLLFTASRDKTIRVWNQSPLELLATINRADFDAHTHSVNRLLWTGYDNLLVSAGDDRIVRVWRVERG